MLTLIFLFSIILFLLAYLSYPKFLSKKFQLNNQNETPAHTLRDNIDHFPTKLSILFGHHFSSIAGAGPIVGPIVAAIGFGWLPAFAWILLGSVFIGGVHDFSSLVASIRHNGKSIPEIAKERLGKIIYRLFLIFIWLSLIYVLIVFVDLTSKTFVADGGVATSSILYIFLAILFGLSIYKLKIPLPISTVVFVSLIYLSIWVGQLFPIRNIPVLFGDMGKSWSIFLIFYCFIASVLPVWFLLQPRDYLSSFLLYGSVLAGFIGIIFGGFRITYPLFETFYDKQLGPIFPVLFVTIACGAVSGFHSLVASGTTSKQLNKETDSKTVGYGAMLMEGLVAVIALSTLMIISKDNISGRTPLEIYAQGIGKFLKIIGIKETLGSSFGFLALSSFILTTLDTATRVSRYVFQEFFNLKTKTSRYYSTLFSLFLPTIFVLVTLRDKTGQVIPAWKLIWPIFGTTNQLLAALVLLVVAVWLKKLGRKIKFLTIPMIFMLAVTITSFVFLCIKK